MHCSIPAGDNRHVRLVKVQDKFFRNFMFIYDYLSRRQKLQLLFLEIHGQFSGCFCSSSFRLKNDSAHDLSDSMGLSFSDCKERFLYSTIPLAPAIKMCLLTTDLTLRSFFLYSQRDQCRIIPRGGLPPDAHAKKYNCHPQNFAVPLNTVFYLI